MKSVPLTLLLESREHIVSVELSNGDTYRGKLEKSEDNMNLQMRDVVVTTREGAKSFMASVFVRGSHVRMILLPELLRQAPVLKPALAEKAKATLASKKTVFARKRKAGGPPKKIVRIA